MSDTTAFASQSHDPVEQNASNLSNSVDEESAEARYERLGRERPAKFKSAWAEVGFCFSVVMSQILTEYFVSGFTVILPTIIKDLDIPPAASTWPASAFSLVVSSFLLVFGRVGDIYGGRWIYIGGTAWLTVWSIVAGFSKNQVMLDVCRALQGLGPSAYLPASVMLLGSVYRPGNRKNFVFSVYGGCAVVGFYIGIFFAGLAGQFLSWDWYFFWGAILAGITTVVAYFSIPDEGTEKQGLGVKMDWWGSILISTGLILVVFGITDTAHAPDGFKTPYVVSLFVVGVLLLFVAVYVEGWIADQPLLPADLFATKYMKPLVLALFFFHGGLGIYLLYATFYMQAIMAGSPLQLTAWYTPTAVGGLVIATLGGFFLHMINGTILLLISGVAFIIAPLLFAIMPVGASYWAYTFPAMICTTVAIDIMFNVTNVFITTSMPERRQGLAGALINSILQLSIAFFLGLADIVATKTESPGQEGLRKSYEYVFWLEVAGAAFALVILVLFVRIDEAKSGMTADEKEALEREERDAYLAKDKRCGEAGVSVGRVPTR